MRKFLLPFFLLSFVSFSQITKSEVKEETISDYDSLENFVGILVERYKGQELYLNEKSETLREFGYEGFVWDYKKGTIGNLENVYNPSPTNKFNSDYDKLKGKYFEVIDVLDNPRSGAVYAYSFYLKLRRKDNNDTLYYEYHSKYETSFPFYVVGYYEKMKNSLVNESFVFKRVCIDLSHSDPKTGEFVMRDVFDKWTVVDVSIESKRYKLVATVKNEKGEHLNLDLIGYKEDLLNWEKAEKLRKEYGNEVWRKIMQEEIEVGFSQLQVSLAWGYPKKFDKTSEGEWWIYRDKKVLLKDDKVVKFE